MGSFSVPPASESRVWSTKWEPSDDGPAAAKLFSSLPPQANTMPSARASTGSAPPFFISESWYWPAGLATSMKLAPSTMSGLASRMAISALFAAFEARPPCQPAAKGK